MARATSEFPSFSQKPENGPICADSVAARVEPRCFFLSAVAEANAFARKLCTSPQRTDVPALSSSAPSSSFLPYNNSAIKAAALCAPSFSTGLYRTSVPISATIASAIESGVARSKSIRRPAP